MAFFHIASRRLDELQYLLQLGQIGVRFVGAAQVGLADDFDERSATAVEIDIRVAGRIGEPVVDALAGIVFHVDSGDADAFPDAIHRDVNVPMLGQRLMVLRDLITLRQIRIEIILASEAGHGTDFAV